MSEITTIRSMIEQLPFGAVLQGADGKVYALNSAGERFEKIIEKEFAPKVREGQKHKTARKELRIDGKLRSFRIQGAPTVWNGQIFYLFTFIDVTEFESRAIGKEPELNSEEASTSATAAAAAPATRSPPSESSDETAKNFQTMIDALPDLFLSLDSDGVLTSFSGGNDDGAFATLGESVGKSLADLKDDEILEKLENTRIEALQSQAPQTIGFSTITDKGNSFFEARVIPMTNGDAIIVIRNITDQTRSEIELLEAKEMAEQAAKAKADFLATMSHEIRTPMNGVVGMTGILSQTDLTDEQSEYVETIRVSGENLLFLINDILDFSKIESGKLELEERRFNLRQTVEEALDLFAQRAAEKPLPLYYYMSSDVPDWVIGDSTRLRQVIVNLIGNGLKFTEKGEIRVWITEEYRPKEGVRELKVSVRDTGIGVPADKIDRLFTPFQQVDTSTTRKYGGTGLGLAICKDLVELMGGDIHVESEDGQGSDFFFTFQVKDVPAAEIPEPEAKLELDGPILIQHISENFLLSLSEHGKALGIDFFIEPDIHRAASAPQKQDQKFSAAILSADDALSIEREDLKKMSRDGALPLGLFHPFGKAPEVEDVSFFGVPLPTKVKTLRRLLRENVLKSSQEGPAAESTQKTISSDDQIGKQYPMKILIAEDNPVNQKVATMMFGKLGFEPKIVPNGAEAVQAVREEEWDVVFMDVQMPEMDGLEATRTIRAEVKDGDQVNIVAMTANATQGDREMCIDAGMNDYTTKPLKYDEMKERLLEMAKSVNAAKKAA